MAIRKNGLTTSLPVRRMRRAYRDQVRPRGEDLVASWRSRVLRGSRSHTPDYLIAGTNKAGTTSLHAALTERPDFGSPLRKELHYLDGFPTRPLDWYRACFWGEDGLRWGEATPEYLELQDAPGRLAHAFPHLRVIVCLREPFARAVSHFHNSVDHLSETRTLADAFGAELAALERGERVSAARDLRLAYLQRSLYAAPLARWREAFGDQLLVTCMEGGQMLPQTLAHLGIDPGTPAPLRRANARSYPAADDELRARFAPLVAAESDALLAAARWDAWPEEWVA